MGTVFSDFIRDFETESDAHKRVLKEMQRILVAVLRRRGLYHAGPSLLGYTGDDWDVGDSLQDLVYDCFNRSILQKLRGLRKLLTASGSIDAVVVRNIKSFVWEKQKEQDPIGHAVYQNLKASIRDLVEASELIPLNGPGEQPEPVFRADARYSIRGAAQNIASDESQIKEALLSSGEIFENLESFSTVGVRGQESLSRAILALKPAGVGVFSVKSLKIAITTLLRESSTGLPNTGCELPEELFENLSGNFRTVSEGVGYVESEARAHLIRQVHSEIENTKRSASVKSRLHRLLDLAADVWMQKSGAVEFSVEQLQSTFGIERTTVYDDMKVLGALRERVIVQQSLAKKNGENHG